MKTNIYVDGFNLYYGCLTKSPYKWLDIHQLCNLELPQNTINRIRYFTAQVSGRPEDPDQPVRQQTYIRALQTIPHLSVHYGHFLSSKIRMKLARRIPGLPDAAQLATMSPDDQAAFAKHGLPDMVRVIKSEEKGSDVNIASYLLRDAFSKDCDAAVVISNDSDLMTPIYMARKDLGIRVVALMPCRAPRRPSIELQKAASFHQVIQDISLANSQFSVSLTDNKGIFTKPTTW
jgi:uncharacterized LabA/DUF88 family protein